MCLNLQSRRVWTTPMQGRNIYFSAKLLAEFGFDHQNTKPGISALRTIKTIQCFELRRRTLAMKIISNASPLYYIDNFCDTLLPCIYAPKSKDKHNLY